MSIKPQTSLLSPALQGCEIDQSHLIPKGRFELTRTEQGYVYHVGNRYYDYEAKDASFRLVRVRDNNDNAIHYFYEADKTLPSFVVLDNHRLFAIEGNATRILGLSELEFDKDDLRTNLLQTSVIQVKNILMLKRKYWI